MLPRITPGSFEQTKLIPTPLGLEFWLATFIMKTGWSDAVFFKTWKKNLQDGFTFAFIQGLAAVLSNAFRVPLDQITNESQSSSFQISFHYPPQEPLSADLAVLDTSTIMAEPLAKLFQSAAQQGARKLRIQLELTPKRSVFHRLFGIPLISKQLVEKEDNFLLNLFFKKDKDTDKYVVADQSHFVDYLRSVALEEMETQERESGDEISEFKFATTIAAEAMIICDETFCVWDADTGEVLQGYEDNGTTREVGHMVTMERTYETVLGSGISLMDRTNSNWLMTDCDDLLGPQKWYHVVVPGHVNDDENRTAI